MGGSGYINYIINNSIVWDVTAPPQLPVASSKMKSPEPLGDFFVEGGLGGARWSGIPGVIASNDDVFWSPTTLIVAILNAIDQE